MRSLVAFALLVASACGERSHRQPPPPDPRDYVPRTPGDRFRDRVEPGGRFEHWGVTGVDARGRAVILGTDRASMSLVEARADGVWIVSPTGDRLIPMLVAPVARGTTTRYRLAMGQGAGGDCEVRIRSVDRSATVAGVRFDRCVEQRRVCTLPASDPLARATTITEDETLCPGVGRVKLVFEANPPLPFEGMNRAETATLVGFHVGGGRAMAHGTRLADRLILLPSDVGAACGAMPIGTEIRDSAERASPRGVLAGATPAGARAGDVLLGFAMADGPLLVEARAAPGSTLPAYLATDGTARIGFSTGAVNVRITPNASCRDPSRFEPLLRSMLD